MESLQVKGSENSGSSKQSQTNVCCLNRVFVPQKNVCPHLKHFKENGGQENFYAIQQYLQSRSLKIPDIKNRKITCLLCPSNTYAKRIHACLDCVFFGCWQEHLEKHFQETNHYLVIDIVQNQIYCFGCGDYIYDSEFETVTLKEKNTASVINHFVKDSNPFHILYSGWTPTKSETDALLRNAKMHPVPSHLAGLRGLTNLGNTCFMNSILQALIHNPLLRNYFLSDMHNRKICTHRMKPERGGVCLGCEMDYLFAEVFSGNKQPFSPYHFLYSVWKYANYFAGYEQQDAHEFLITTLNGIHSHCEGTSKECNCIIHKTFSGVLRSDVTCFKCGHTSTTYDPFFDISIDLKKRSKKIENPNEIATLGTLPDCLNAFTQPEKLENEEKFFCSKCSSYQDSTKQFSFHALPRVMCFHLKRFEQPRNKLDHFVSFPEEIDLSPFKSTVIAKQKKKRKFDQMTESYKLFAVINHTGSMENGHYICYVLHEGSWIMCNDGALTPSNLDQVLKTKGYLLFYIKEFLDYDKKEKEKDKEKEKNDAK